MLLHALFTNGLISFESRDCKDTYRVKWHHSNLWSLYDFYVVRQHGVLCSGDFSRYSNKIGSVGLGKCPHITVLLRKWCHNNKHISTLAQHRGRKTAGMKKLRHCHPMYCNRQIGLSWRETIHIIGTGQFLYCVNLCNAKPMRFQALFLVCSDDEIRWNEISPAVYSAAARGATCSC